MHGIENSACAVAFKEWAIVCEALAQGRQTIILRKGGIHEGREGFRVAHPQFWLLPTRFHASPGALVSAAEDFRDAAAALNRDDAFGVRYLAVVEEVCELTRESDALALSGLHVWADATVRERFYYKRPGLYCLLVRIYIAGQTTWIEDSPQIAGCRSWVDLPGPLPTSNLTAALDGELFAARCAEVHSRWASTRH